MFCVSKVYEHGKNYSEDEYYFGYKWQCVEFVKRFYSKQFIGRNAPELYIYGSRLMFCAEKEIVSVSLIDSLLQTNPAYPTCFKDNIAISVTHQPIRDENLEPCDRKAMLTVYLWPDGELSEPYVFEAPEPLISYRDFEDREIKDIEYDTESNQLTIYQSGWKHMVDLDTYEILTEDNFPVPPYKKRN